MRLHVALLCMVVALAGGLFIPSTVAAACCTAVEGVCSECCPGPSCGCAYGHETGKCVCTGCDVQLETVQTMDVLRWLSDEQTDTAPALSNTAVFVGDMGEVLLFSKAEIAESTFSTGVDLSEARFSLKFRNTRVDEALRLLAAAGGFDITMPDDLTGRIDGLFTDYGLQEAVELVMEAADGDWHVEARPNGLIHLHQQP